MRLPKKKKKRSNSLVEHPVHTERRLLDYPGMNFMQRVSPHTWHTRELHPGVQTHFRVFLAGKSNDVVMWMRSYCTLESDNSTCWFKESINLHPILI